MSLTTVYNNLLPHFQLSDKIENDSKTLKYYGVKYSILKWDNEKFKSSLSKVKKLFPNNDEDLIEDYFLSSIIELSIDKLMQKNFKSKYNKLKEDLERLVVERSICIPIKGITLEDDLIDFKFGKLYKNTKGILPSLVEDKNSLSSYQHGINALKKCDVYFQVDINSDSKKAFKIAYERVSFAISILNLFLGSSQYRITRENLSFFDEDISFYHERKRKIEIYGKESEESQIYYEFRHNSDETRNSKFQIDFNYIQLGHRDNEFFDSINDSNASIHNLNVNTSKLIVNDNNKAILDCINQNNPISKKLYQTINWYSKAINCDNHEEQFLFFAISLESLLVGDESSGQYSSQGSITQKISERAAFLAGIGFEDKLKIESDVKKLYGIRSKIVHTGVKTTNDEVLKIEELTRKLIFEFSKYNFQSTDSFLKWIKEKQYN